MNIRNWGLGDIMQLPDCCFGRRWPIGVGVMMAGPPDSWFDIAESALPERTVIWELILETEGPTSVVSAIALALGDHLPTADAEFLAMEPLFPGVRSFAGNPSEFAVRDVSPFHRRLRMSVAVMGRRIVMRVARVQETAVEASAIVVVSSVPTEVPDWLISGNLKSP